MKTIYKYPLELNDEDIASVELPLESELLHVDLQNNHLFVWAMIDTDLTMTGLRRIMVKGTGHPIPEDRVLRHINSWMSMGGLLVLHAFEVLS